ncbi:uncharacterized protein LOC104906903 [Beta vulgaris subsp. vulgaris]|uniref:uncharacterized protein LOC104906903 n=1 Tax=Beta vulgaris subsp. vulgaris TaxID=3555 RepID=UPI00053F8F93|nr:uncharacterized protein LOC104906903 [Beta vulgaris subsp. vulgaris]
MKEKEEAAKCDVIPFTQSLFQVSYYLDTLIVELIGRNCTCRKWDMTGLPCCDAIATIFFIHKNVEDYVHPSYDKEAYIKAYVGFIPPIEGERHWPRIEFDVDPPPIKVGPERPRKTGGKTLFKISKDQ